MGRLCDGEKTAIGRSHRKYLRRDRIALQIFAMDQMDVNNETCDLRYAIGRNDRIASFCEESMKRTIENVIMR